MVHVLTEVADAIATVTLDHERWRNALSHALVEEVIGALCRFRDLKARVVILRARPGAKIFSAGHDIVRTPPSRSPRPSSACPTTPAARSPSSTPPACGWPRR